MNKWTESDIFALKTGIASGKSHKQIADEIGKSKNAVRSKCSLIGETKDRFWKQEEIDKLKNLYEKAGFDEILLLDNFAKEIGKHKSNISRKARELGLSTSKKRKKVEQRKDRRKFKGNKTELKNHISNRMKQWIKENGHPRGTLGMKHTEETKQKISQKSKQINNSFTEEQKIEIVKKIMATRIKNGTYAPERHKTTWKAGWRTIGGKDKFYRSRWEANYARYLEWLKTNNEIKNWEHEPQTFWFENIKRGSVSYLPDFQVIENDGKESFHEVKGWMDSRSQTKLNRMSKYYPNVKIVLIREKDYKEIERKISKFIIDWER